METMLEKLEEKYGSVEGFIAEELDYTKQEIEQMRANLRGSA